MAVASTARKPEAERAPHRASPPPGHVAAAPLHPALVPLVVGPAPDSALALQRHRVALDRLPVSISRQHYVPALARQHGNRHLQRVLGPAPGSGVGSRHARRSHDPAGHLAVQRCGGEVHAGCACAEGAAPVAAPVAAVQRLDAERPERFEPAPGPPAQPSEPEGKPLTSPFWASNARLQAAVRNAPPLKVGERGEAVRLLQEALVQQGQAMPGSTKPDGSLDGAWGDETTTAVRAFQTEAGVRPVGGWEAGRKTLGALDERLGSGPEPPVPPKPVPPTAQHEGVHNEDIPILAAGPNGAAGEAATPALAFAITAPVSDAPVGGPPNAIGAGGKPIAVPFKLSVQESIFLVARWLVNNNDALAAVATKKLLADAETNFFEDKVNPDGTTQTVASSLDAYTAFAAKKGSVTLGSTAVEFLCEQLGTTPDQMAVALAAEKQFGDLRKQAEHGLMFDNFGQGLPTNPDEVKKEKHRAGAKRHAFPKNFEVLKRPQVAQMYVATLEKFAKPTLPDSEVKHLLDNGLDAEEIKKIIGGDPRRQLVTDFFTQGVKEFEEANAGDLAGGFLVLEEAVLGQWSWGNPTAVQNQLKIGVGIPEQDLGLVYRPDNTLYYDRQGQPFPSFAGGAFRDPGFKAGGKDPGKLINVDAISDPTIRGFFKLLHDRFGKTTLLVTRGAEAYWKNREEVDKRVQKGLDAEVAQHMGQAVLLIIGFLSYRAAAMALQRTRHAVLQAVGASMEVLADAAGFILQIDFIGSLEATLVGAGFEMVHATPPEEGKSGYDALSEMHIERAAAMIRPVIADIVVQLILAGVAKGLSREKAREAARAELEGVTKGGKRARIKCTVCMLVTEAAEFSKEVGKEIYKGAVEAGTVKPGKVAKNPVVKGKVIEGVELHPDGNMYGPFGKLKKVLKEGQLTEGGGKKFDFEANHLLEENQARLFGITREEGLCVALERSDHDDFSRFMRGSLSKKNKWPINELYQAHVDMFNSLGHPEYVEQLRGFLREKKPKILEAYESGKAPGAKDPFIMDGGIDPETGKRFQGVRKFLESL
jgi:peptidoglycan hydrolase-like protein with peptidoglycan-binding domain